MTGHLRRSARVGLVWLAAAYLALGAGPTWASHLYDVVGVARDDALNVRSNVVGASALSQTKVVGSIPWNAKGVLATGVTTALGGTLWREVQYGSVAGWVSDRFLRPIGGADPAAAPADLDCAGTEPFWSLRVRGAAATFRALGDDGEPTQLELEESLPAVGRPGMWQLVLRTPSDTKDRLALLTRTGACSDGMSDLTYAYELVLMETRPTSGPLQGCCSLPR